MTTLRIILLMIFFGLAGCVTHRTEEFKVDPQHYVVMESNATHHMQVVMVRNSLMLRGPLFNPLEGSDHDYLILTEKVPSDLRQADRLFARSEPWRMMDNGFRPSFDMLHDARMRIMAIFFPVVALAITPLDTPEDPHTSEPIRWIISTNPVIIAIGDSHAVPNLTEAMSNDGHVQLCSTLRLVTVHDLEERVHEVVMLPQWPKQWPKELGAMPLDQAISPSLQTEVRHLHVPMGTTLRNVFDDRTLLGK